MRKSLITKQRGGLWARLTAFMVVLMMTTAQMNAQTPTVTEDPASSYTPTNIINGTFDQSPWMNYYYNSMLYDGISKYHEGDVDATSTVKNGVDEGWNSSTLKVQAGILFDYQNNSLKTGPFTEPGTGRRIYNWDPTSMNTKMSKATLDARGGFIECNCAEAATLYQDLTTFGGDVIRWSFLHGVRYDKWASNVQPMTVYVGAPNGTPTNTNPAIVEATLGKYYSNTGNDGHAEGEGRAYGNVDELKYLRLNKTDHATDFYTTAGVYVVPEGQTVTRFAFQSNADSPRGGNWMDDVTFSTLIGNLHANLDDYGNVIITGYWGDADATKKLFVKVGETVNELDMTSVTNKNFKITFPKEKIGDATEVEIYHQDYEQAKRTVTIDPYKQVTNFGPKFKGGFQYTNGINPYLGTAAFTDNGATVNGSTRAVTKEQPITFKVPNGYKYYDGTTYDMYFKITSNIDMASPKWKFQNDGSFLTLAFDNDTYKDFNMEMWLQNGSAIVDYIDVIGGSCYMGGGEGTRPYSDDGYIYTNIDGPESIWAWDADKSAWYSKDVYNTNSPDIYILGHGMSVDHTLKGGYYGSYNCGGEFVFGYITKNVTFRAEFADGSAATDVTFSYTNPATFSNNVLKVPVDKAIGTLPTATPSTVTHWYVGNDKTTTYTAEQISALTVTADMTVTAVMPAVCVNTTTNKQYAMVQSAVNEAATNVTIKVLANTTENVTISGKAITLDLNGNNLEKKSGTNAITVSNGSLTITDGNTETAGGVNGGISKDNSSTVKIEGGKYSFDPTPFLDKYHAAKPTGTQPYIYEVVSDPDLIVCTDGTHSFTSLQQAIVFNMTATIELSKDIEENIEIAIDQDIILDLKGKTITSKSGGTVITNNGTLTVIDSSDGNGIITGATTNYAKGIDNNGTLNLYAGNVTGNTNGVADYNTLTVGGKAVISLNGPAEGRMDLCLPDNTTFTIATGDHAPAETMLVGITTQTAPSSGNDITLTGENGKDYSQHFFGDDSKYSVINTENNVLKLTNEVKIIISAEPVEGGEVKIYDNKNGKYLDETERQHILYGTSVTIEATAFNESGFAFAGWFNKTTGEYFSKTQTYTFDATESLELEARFTNQVIWVRVKKGN